MHGYLQWVRLSLVPFNPIFDAALFGKTSDDFVLRSRQGQRRLFRQSVNGCGLAGECGSLPGARLGLVGRCQAAPGTPDAGRPVNIDCSLVQKPPGQIAFIAGRCEDTIGPYIATGVLRMVY